MSNGKPASAGPEPPVRAIVGLGNPGKAYAATRHNVGFMAIELLAARHGANWTAKFNGLFGRCQVVSSPTGGVQAQASGRDPTVTTSTGDHRTEVVLLQPQTYMNLSGHPTQQLAAFFGFKAEELLIIHDDLDLPFGKVQIKVAGGHGGHNGLRSLVAQLGSNAFVRVRIGIGRPTTADDSHRADSERGGDTGRGGDGAVTQWVLSPFSLDQRIALPEVLQRAVAAIEAVLRSGARAASNSHNGNASHTSAGGGTNRASS